MRDKVFYEFVINEMEGEDIHDNHVYDSLSELIEKLHFYTDDTVEFEIWKISGNENEGITDRDYAAFSSTVPTHFDEGESVPKSIQRQFTKKRIETLKSFIDRN